ncbi:MAG: hypothetical protein MMC33_006467 [Icmadophila ericetorum]|nr:hypothetical protein [Icmadophila ericetorum]
MPPHRGLARKKKASPLSISTSVSEIPADASSESTAVSPKRKASRQSLSYYETIMLRELLEDNPPKSVRYHINGFYRGSMPIIEMLSNVFEIRFGMPTRTIGESRSYLCFQRPIYDNILLYTHASGQLSLDRAQEPCKLVTVLTASTTSTFNLAERVQLQSLCRYVLELRNVLKISPQPSECLLLRPRFGNLLIEQLRSSRITHPYLQQCFVDLDRSCPLDAISNLCRAFRLRAKIIKEKSSMVLDHPDFRTFSIEIITDKDIFGQPLSTTKIGVAGFHPQKAQTLELDLAHGGFASFIEILITHSNAFKTAMLEEKQALAAVGKKLAAAVGEERPVDAKTEGNLTTTEEQQDAQKFAPEPMKTNPAADPSVEDHTKASNQATNKGPRDYQEGELKKEPDRKANGEMKQHSGEEVNRTREDEPEAMDIDEPLKENRAEDPMQDANAKSSEDPKGQIEQLPEAATQTNNATDPPENKSQSATTSPLAKDKTIGLAYPNSLITYSGEGASEKIKKLRKDLRFSIKPRPLRARTLTLSSLARVHAANLAGFWPSKAGGNN